MYYRSCVKMWSSVGRHLLCRRMFRPIIIHQKSTATSFNDKDFLGLKDLTLGSFSLRYGCPPPGVSLSQMEAFLQVDEVSLFLDHFRI